MFILSKVSEEILAEAKEQKDEEVITNFWMALMKHQWKLQNSHRYMF